MRSALVVIVIVATLVDVVEAQPPRAEPRPPPPVQRFSPDTPRLPSGNSTAVGWLRMHFNDARAHADRTGACRIARQLLRAPELTDAQRSQYRQYIGAQCH